MIRKWVLLLTLLSLTSTSFAGEVKFGDLLIFDGWIRETPPNHPVTGGYISITNNGKNAERLVAVSADFAGTAEVHEMRMSGDVMKMQVVEGGLLIPPQQTVHLKPGGYHLMFMKLKQQMKQEEVHSVELTFEKAGSVSIKIGVQAVTYRGHQSH